MVPPTAPVPLIDRDIFVEGMYADIDIFEGIRRRHRGRDRDTEADIDRDRFVEGIEADISDRCGYMETIMKWTLFLGPGGMGGHSPFALNGKCRSPMMMHVAQILWSCIVLRATYTTSSLWQESVKGILQPGVERQYIGSMLIRSTMLGFFFVGGSIHMFGILVLCVCRPWYACPPCASLCGNPVAICGMRACFPRCCSYDVRFPVEVVPLIRCVKKRYARIIRWMRRIQPELWEDPVAMDGRHGRYLYT